MTLSITLVGGPTALIELDGFRILTDPTFDAPRAYQLPHVRLEKLSGPALRPEAIGEVDPSCSVTTSTRTISIIRARIFWRRPIAC